MGIPVFQVRVMSLVEESIKIGRGITSTPYYIRGISHIDMRKYIFA